MRKTVAHWLRRLASWLDPEADLVPLAVVTVAEAAVRQLGTAPHTGAFKKALAMKVMMTRYPRTSRAQLSLAIELAVKRVKEQK